MPTNQHDSNQNPSGVPFRMALIILVILALGLAFWYFSGRANVNQNATVTNITTNSVQNLNQDTP